MSELSGAAAIIAILMGELVIVLFLLYLGIEWCHRQLNVDTQEVRKHLDGPRDSLVGYFKNQYRERLIETRWQLQRETKVIMVNSGMPEPDADQFSAEIGDALEAADLLHVKFQRNAVLRVKHITLTMESKKSMVIVRLPKTSQSLRALTRIHRAYSILIALP